MLRIVDESKETQVELRPSLDELARRGAQRMIAEALEMEVEDYLGRHRAERDEEGLALVVRNGHGRGRRLVTGAGVMEIRAPRVNDRRRVDGVRQKFTSRVLPPWARRSPKVTEVLPLLYLHGLSTGDFRQALPALLGEEACGLSASAISRLTESWKMEQKAWKERSLAETDYVYVWVDGVHFGVRLEEERLAVLVVVGVRTDGTKEVVAVEDGYRESAESWRTLLRDLKARGMRAPAVAVGDGALGFWTAAGEVWPETKEQRCWVHKIANVLDKLPKSVQPKAKRMLHEMMYAPDKKTCEREQEKFTQEFSAKYPKATECLKKDWERMLTFLDFPAEHWVHLRSTNPVESTFATVKLRTRVTRGAGSRENGLAMAFKLLLEAQKHWRKINAPNLAPLVRAGMKFKDGIQIRSEETRNRKAA